MIPCADGASTNTVLMEGSKMLSLSGHKNIFLLAAKLHYLAMR